MKPLNSENLQEVQMKQIPLAAEGDQDAISQLYELTYNPVYRTVKSMVQDEDAVLDIVQDSYVKAFQSLDQLDKPENFSAWMKRIATNKAKDYFKKKRPILFSEMANETDEEVDFRDDRTENLPEEVIDQQETTRLMNEILDSLSEDQRLVIGMFYYEQMSVKEIAEALGCSENTVKSRLNYGRKKVEAKVLDLEKRGTKLYSLAPLPFLLWLFRMDAQAASVVPPAEPILSRLQSQRTGTSGVDAANTTASTAGNTAASASEAASAGVKAASAGAKAVGAGGKALATKIVAGVLAAAFLGGGAVAVITSNGKRDTDDSTQSIETTLQTESIAAAETVAAETSIPTETTLPPRTADHAYEEVLAEYVQAMTTDPNTESGNSYQYINKDLSAIWYYHISAPAFQLYTARYDINQDGVEELLIGLEFHSQFQVVDVYAFDGEKAVHLVDKPSLGSDPCKLEIMTDGTMYFREAPDGISSTHELMKIAEDGYSLEVIDHVYYEAGQDSGPLDALQGKVAALTPVEDFPWNLLTPEQIKQQPPIETTGSEEASEAFSNIIADYEMLINLDHDAFLDDTTIGERFPYLDEMMYFYHSSPDAYAQDDWCYTTEDIDGDGIPELLIGFGDTEEIRILDAFTWDGEKAEKMGVEGNCEILADGTILDHAGNGGEIVGIYKLENSILVEKQDTQFQLGFPSDAAAYQTAIDAHGGYYIPDKWVVI